VADDDVVHRELVYRVYTAFAAFEFIVETFETFEIEPFARVLPKREFEVIMAPADQAGGIVIIVIVCHEHDVRADRRRFDPDGFSVMRIDDNCDTVRFELETCVPVPSDSHMYRHPIPRNDYNYAVGWMAKIIIFAV
jgi:hypothetical protein